MINEHTVTKESVKPENLSSFNRPETTVTSITERLQTCTRDVSKPKPISKLSKI